MFAFSPDVVSKKKGIAENCGENWPISGQSKKRRVLSHLWLSCFYFFRSRSEWLDLQARKDTRVHVPVPFDCLCSQHDQWLLGDSAMTIKIKPAVWRGLGVGMKRAKSPPNVVFSWEIQNDKMIEIL